MQKMWVIIMKMIIMDNKNELKQISNNVTQYLKMSQI